MERRIKDKIKYLQPYKVKVTTINTGNYFNNPKPQYMEKSSAIYTHNGIVMCYQINWATNSKKIVWTMFRMIKRGWMFTAEIPEAPISDQAMMNWATRFSNYVYQHRIANNISTPPPIEGDNS